MIGVVCMQFRIGWPVYVIFIGYSSHYELDTFHAFYAVKIHVEVAMQRVIMSANKLVST